MPYFRRFWVKECLKSFRNQNSQKKVYLYRSTRLGEVWSSSCEVPQKNNWLASTVGCVTTDFLLASPKRTRQSPTRFVLPIARTLTEGPAVHSSNACSNAGTTRARTRGYGGRLPSPAYTLQCRSNRTSLEQTGSTPSR